jgi:hypothetical protein
MKIMSGIKGGFQMKMGDVFILEEGEVQGYYSRWGKEENRETEIEPIPRGNYYIQKETDAEYLIAEVFGVDEFQVLGKKHCYFVSKEQLLYKRVEKNVYEELIERFL